MDWKTNINRIGDPDPVSPQIYLGVLFFIHIFYPTFRFNRRHERADHKRIFFCTQGQRTDKKSIARDFDTE